MSVYQYKAKRINGTYVKGKIEANDENQVYQTLRDKDEFLISLKRVEEKVNETPLKSKDLADFANQLGTMLSAGISLSRTLSIIAQRTNQKMYQLVKY